MSDEELLLVRVRVTRTSGNDDRQGEGDPETAAAALWAEGATAVEVREDAEGVTLLAGYPTAAAARTAAKRLSHSLGARVEPVTDTTWRDAWRVWAQPVAIGDRLLVVPSWRPVAVGAGRVSLEIDPGPCFGSGTHASTRMLLAWLDTHPPVGAEVVDVGTGSGILAVAAARLGAQAVIAVDIDPAAVVVTEANATRNGVRERVHVSTIPVGDLPADCADLVLVNVTAGTHALVGERSSATLRSGGILLVAGLLPGQWPHVADAYRGLTEVERLALDGWEGAVLRRDSLTSSPGAGATHGRPS